MKKSLENENFIAKNKKAFFDYEILEALEAGISLLGAEVKAIKAARVQLKDSFVKIMKNEAFLFGTHISVFVNTNAFFRPDPNRAPKLLLHKSQINRLHEKVTREGLTIVPLQIYTKKNKIKLQIALVRGKKLHDKRQILKEKTQMMEMRRELKNFKGV